MSLLNLVVPRSMLEDKTVEPYVKWLRTEHGDAFLIPDTEAFVANVMPKHFKEMTQVCMSPIPGQMRFDIMFRSSGIAFKNS